MSNALDVVVLAAGQGKRMRSALPKVLHPLGGKPIVGHVIDAVQTLAPRTICVVYGHGGEPVREALHRRGLAFALQDPPRGTGERRPFNAQQRLTVRSHGGPVTCS